MRKVDDGKKEKRKKKKRMAFLVATTSLPAVYHPNGYARTTTAGTPHARANKAKGSIAPYLALLGNSLRSHVQVIKQPGAAEDLRVRGLPCWCQGVPRVSCQWPRGFMIRSGHISRCLGIL